jgi:tetratricopeptide (TPR) repeat protein
LTAEIAQEVCVRNNGAALLQGAVVALGSHYMLTLAASDCATGRQLVADKQEAARREDVPSALDRLIERVRQRLGESVRSVRRYDVPLVPAQTASLDALKAYSEGKWLAEHGRQSDAIPLYQHAAELDPQFAMAYAGLSIAYATLYDQPRSLEAIRSAYALRDVANEHDRFRIAVLYDQFGTRDYNAALRDLHMWTEIYPADPIGWSNLANAEEYVGRHALAAADGRHALALKPGIEATYAVVMRAELGQGHYAAAKALGQAATAAGLGGDAVHSDLLKVAVAQGDARDYAAQTTWAANNPSARMTPADEAEVAFQRGQVRQGMAIFDRLSADAAAQGEPNYLVSERARLLADFGLYSQAKALLARWRGPPDHEYLFSLAELDDPQVARQALDAEMKRMPADSLLHELYAPEISAELALRRHAPAEALKALAPATRYEAHDVTVLYLIGAAWLAQGQGDRAMAAFQTLLDHRGWYPTSQIFPLAQLGLARAQRLAGQVEASRDTYRRLLTDWRDADSDLPVLKQARNELAGVK